VITLLEPWFSNRAKSLVKTPKLHFRDTGLCAFLMGIVSRDDLMNSPLAGALWESMVCGELQRLIETGPTPWQLAFWRDRTKEADFLLHRAGHFRLADANWSEHPEDGGKLALVRRELKPSPPCAIVCRSPNRYPMADGIEAIPLAGLPVFLQSPFP
jgi:predicted AAA+ superfamily ATPase